MLRKPSSVLPSSSLKSNTGRTLRFENLESRQMLSATDIQILAAGLSGSETMALEVAGVEVERWENIGGNFDAREYSTYSYTHAESVTADDIVVRMVDSSGAGKDLRVDGIAVDGVKYESEADETWSTGGWDNSLQAITARYGSGEFIFANYGAFEYSATAGSSITVDAAGATLSESMNLLIDGQVVATWDNVGGDYDGRSFLSFTYDHPTKVSPDQVRVEFTNDGLTVEDTDRNLRVDAVTIDGRRWETEAATTFSTGTWADGEIAPSFPAEEDLNGNGYFQYSSAEAGGSQIIAYLAGSTGEESVDLTVDGNVVATFDALGGDYDNRDFVAYPFVHPNLVTLDQVAIAFTNDTNTELGDRNVRVDAISLDGTLHEAEAITTYSTATWQPVLNIVPGFWQSELMHTNGVFQFGQDTSQTGTVSLGATQYTVNEAGDTFVDIEFVRTGGTLGTITIDYTTLDGTAIAGEDYVATNGTAVFAEGQEIATVRIVILDDDADEGTHTFNVAADRVTGGAFLGQPRTTTISIFDDEAPGLGNGNGLRGDYFTGVSLTDLVTSRNDATVDFDWINGSPHTRIPNNNFSVRWTGEILPRFTEEYTFQTRSDDGIRLWVNDVQLINSWVDQSAAYRSGTISLEAGTKYDIRIEYYERGGEAVAELRWSSASQVYEVVPQTQLFSDVVPSEDGVISGQTIVSGLVQPTAIDFAEVGETDLMFIAQKNGNVQLAIDGVLQSNVFLDYTTEVNDVRDRGLLGLAVHPDFVNNPYVYILYTYDPPETQTASGLAAPDNYGNRGSRLTRVTADASTGYTSIVAGSEVVLLGTASTWGNISDPYADSTNNMNLTASGEQPDGSIVDDILVADSQSHTIGALAFAPDGSLYVTNGDGTSYGRVDARTTRVQRLDSLSGKMLRIDPLTGEGYADNPFYTGDTTDDQSKILNYGLRNPFRFAIDPSTGVPYIGDVGWTAWEEINAGIGENFGWPYYEGGNGQNLQTGGYSSLAEAQAFYASGAEAEPAVWSRSHAAGGVSIVMGDFYTGGNLPELYNDVIFFTDYGDPVIRGLQLDDEGNVAEQLVISGSMGVVVEMSMGPDGYMYYVDLVGGVVGRFEYTPTVVTATAAASTLMAPATVVAPSVASQESLEESAPAVDSALELLLELDSAAEGSSFAAEEVALFDEQDEEEATAELEAVFATI